MEICKKNSRYNKKPRSFKIAFECRQCVKKFLSLSSRREIFFRKDQEKYIFGTENVLFFRKNFT